MKQFKPKKWFLYSRLLLIVCVFYFLSGDVLNEINVFTSENENLAKAIELDVIEENQRDLFLSDKTIPIKTFMGELTGYAGDCPKCSGVVACKRINVLEEGIYYNDKDYGKVRMVASSRDYPCGTVLKFNVGKIQDDPIIAIVMDRGVSGNVIDLLTESASYARSTIGRVKNQKFDVLRVGWTRK